MRPLPVLGVALLSFGLAPGKAKSFHALYLQPAQAAQAADDHGDRLPAFSGPLFPNPIVFNEGYMESVARADLDGDLDLDLAVGNCTYLPEVSVLLNNGDGTFAPPASYFAGWDPIFVATGDVDGDLDSDLAIVNFGNDTLSVLLNRRFP